MPHMAHATGSRRGPLSRPSQGKRDPAVSVHTCTISCTDAAARLLSPGKDSGRPADSPAHRPGRAAAMILGGSAWRRRWFRPGKRRGAGAGLRRIRGQVDGRRRHADAAGHGACGRGLRARSAGGYSRCWTAGQSQRVLWQEEAAVDVFGKNGGGSDIILVNLVPCTNTSRRCLLEWLISSGPARPPSGRRAGSSGRSAPPDPGRRERLTQERGGGGAGHRRRCAPPHTR